MIEEDKPKQNTEMRTRSQNMIDSKQNSNGGVPLTLLF
jgi:hypothetical protein